MLFTLLGLCVGLCVGLASDLQGTELKDFDINKVVTVIVSQVPWGLGPAQSQPSIFYHLGCPSPLELSRLLHPLEGRDVEWLSGSQILNAGTPRQFLPLTAVSQFLGLWYEIAFASMVDTHDLAHKEQKLGAMTVNLEENLLALTTAYYK